MTRSRRVRLAMGAVLALVLTPVALSSAQPAPSGSAVASASAPPAPPAPPIDGSWPRTETPVPTAEEWKQAEPVSLTRQGRGAVDCRAHRLREWLKVHCPTLVTASIAILGGSSDDVHLWKAPLGEHGVPGPGADIVMAVRPGDRRVLQVLGVGFGYEGISGMELSFVLSEQWVEGDAAPIVTTS